MSYESKLKIKIILSFFKYAAFGFRPLSKTSGNKKPYKIQKVSTLFYFLQKIISLKCNKPQKLFHSFPTSVE
jgi:hypothetical protein